MAGGTGLGDDRRMLIVVTGVDCPRLPGVTVSVQRGTDVVQQFPAEGSVVTWTLDAQPIVSPEEQIENTSLYYEPANKTWFLFTNHIGVDDRGEYTDSVWVYWTQDLNHWDAHYKAVVLDKRNCTWSKDCIGLPSVVKLGKRLAVLYDAPGGSSVSHMRRDIGLAWLDLPLRLPEQIAGQ